MVFANIYSRLNEIEQKVAALGSVEGGVASVQVSEAVDLTPLNNKLDALESKSNDLSAKFDSLPTPFVSQQDITNIYDKINQITGILAQLNVQLNAVTEKANSIEATLNDS